MKWVYLTTAPDQTTAEMWLDLLRQEGISAMVRPDTLPFLGVAPYPCRLMVEEHQVERAREILKEYLGDESAQDNNPSHRRDAPPS